MFELANKGIVAWPFNLTQQQGDAFVDVPVAVSFRVFTRAELRERNARAMTNAVASIYDLARKQAPIENIHAAAATMDKAARDDEAALLERIVAWKGFGSGGVEQPYTADAARKLFESEPHYQAFWAALLEASRESRPKNSSPGADGSARQAPTTTA